MSDNPQRHTYTTQAAREDVLEYWMKACTEANKRIAELEQIVEGAAEARLADNRTLYAQIDVLTREREALAAALVSTPFPSMIDNDAPGSKDANLTLTWRKQRVFDWWATREPDFITARKILAARLAAERKAVLSEVKASLIQHLGPVASEDVIFVIEQEVERGEVTHDVTK